MDLWVWQYPRVGEGDLQAGDPLLMEAVLLVIAVLVFIP